MLPLRIFSDSGLCVTRKEILKWLTYQFDLASFLVVPTRVQPDWWISRQKERNINISSYNSYFQLGVVVPRLSDTCHEGKEALDTRY
jgi:hypothetical protein